MEDEEGGFWVLEGDICPSVSSPLFPSKDILFFFFLDLGKWQFECKRGKKKEEEGQSILFDKQTQKRGLLQSLSAKKATLSLGIQ